MENALHKTPVNKMPVNTTLTDKVLDMLPVGYLATDAEGRVTAANPFISGLLQMPKDTLIVGRRLREIMTVGTRIYFETHVRPLMNMQGSVREISVELTRADGLPVPVLMNAVALRNQHGDIDTVQYTFFDASQRIKYESELLQANQKQEAAIAELNAINRKYLVLAQELEQEKNTYKKQSELYREISEVGRVGGWELDLATGKIHLSPVAKEIHEVPPGYELKLSTGIAFYKEGATRESIRAKFKDAIMHGTSFDEELQMFTARGREIWVRLKIYAERSTDTTIRLAREYQDLARPEGATEFTVRLYGTLQDINLHKNTVLQLQQRNERIRKDAAYYKSTIENNSFCIMKTDLEGNCTFVNPFFCEMLGIKSEDYLGRSSLKLILAEDHEICRETVRQCFTQPDAVHWTTLRKFSAEGIIITNQWEFRLLRDEHGNFTEFLCIGHEITDLINKQRLLETQLVTIKEQNSRLQNFTHIISHNVRSHVANLDGIIGLTDMTDEQDREHSFNLIKTTVGALDETIQHLNEIVGIQSSTELPFSLVNVKQVITQAVQSIHILVKDSNASVRCHFDGELCLKTSPAYFESIVLNLITNAIKYRSPDRDLEIDISIDQHPNGKTLVVKDNGLGIDLKKHKDKVFGLYKTFHGNKDAKGLGLFMTKTQVEAMKGTIEVDSEPNQGTTFRIYFNEKS